MRAVPASAERSAEFAGCRYRRHDQGATPVKRLTHLLGGAVLACLILGTAWEDLAAAPTASATIRLKVPADAIVEIDGHLVKQKGIERVVVTPLLDVNKTFSYH